MTETDERRYKVWKEDERIDIAKAVEGYHKWPEEFRRQLIDLKQALHNAGAAAQIHKLEIDELMENPVKPRVNWWNTMKVMNGDEVERYYCALQRATKEYEKCWALIKLIQAGQYEHPRLVITGDGLGDGSWLDIERY